MHFRPLDFALSLSLKDTLNLRSFGYTPMYHTSFFMIFHAGHKGDNFVHDFHDFSKIFLPASGVVEDFPYLCWGFI